MASKAKSSKARAKSPDKKKATRSFDSTPWNGQVDADELLRPGGSLLAMLAGRAQQLGHSRSELATNLGVTYGYIAQLRSGHRQTQHISDAFASACARYLGVPKITVLLAGGAVNVEDMFEKPDEIVSALPRAIAYIQSDPVFGPSMPAELTSQNLPPYIQFYVVRLFEAARGCKLIPGEHSVETISQSMRIIEDTRKEMQKKLAA